MCHVTKTTIPGSRRFDPSPSGFPEEVGVERCETCRRGALGRDAVAWVARRLPESQMSGVTFRASRSGKFS